LVAKSFDAEGNVGESGWAAIYEGVITPPETGDYRFVGKGDDALLVSVNEKAVLWSVTSGGLNMQAGVIDPQSDWTPGYSSDGTPPRIWNGDRHYGSWVRLTKGARYRIKIVFAEGYGKTSEFQLQIQQRHGNSLAAPAKTEPLPVFTLAPLTSREIAVMKKTDLPAVFSGLIFGADSIDKK
jgi:hypothetical protein